MKQRQKTRISILFSLSMLAFGISVSAQDSTAAEPTVSLRYFASNNNIQYLLVQSRIKVERKFQPLPGRVIQVYLDSNTSENLLSKTITDETGTAKVFIPPAFKEKWLNSAKHSFIAVLEPILKEEEKSATLEITKAKIVLDTSSSEGTRTISVKVMYLEKNDWVPAKDVEMKIGVVRSAGLLSAGDKETYTTDSTGMTSVEFNKDSLKGDQHGNFVLAAKVEDNEAYGNLLVEKTVPWGTVVNPENNFFDQRTLWTTRFRTPFWLLFIAYSIFISVWGTMIYLIVQIVKIKRIGVAST